MILYDYQIVNVHSLIICNNKLTPNSREQS